MLELARAEQNNSDPATQGVIYIPSLEAEWGNRDGEIIEQLGLNFRQEYFGFPFEESMVSNMKALYEARKPFISYSFAPHFSFDPRSGLNLTRVQLQDWVDTCNQNTDPVACIYPSDPLISVVGTSLKAKSEQVFDLMVNFRYQSNAGKDLRFI